MPTELEYLAMVMLLPLIPAVVLYWLLPSDAWVEGPLKGWKIHLTGAFAAYFALFLATSGVAYGHMKPLRDRIADLEVENATLRGQYQTWTVVLNRTGLDKTGNNPFNRLIHVVVHPPDAQPGEDGILSFPLVVPRDASGQPVFPMLTLTYTPPTGNALYEERSVDLNGEPIGPEYKLRRVDAERKIMVMGDLPLKKRRSDYQPRNPAKPLN